MRRTAPAIILAGCLLLLWGMPAAAHDHPFPGASWIWLSEPPRDRDLYVYFRKEFQLDEAPRDFQLAVAADSFYLLSINGRLVGRGPVRSTPKRKFYDVYTREAARHLRPGRNLIAVKVHWLGEGHFSYIPGKPGLLLRASGEVAGRPWRLSSDASWRARASRNHLASARRINQQLGFNEVYDAGLDPSENRWSSPELDDSSWTRALEAGPPLRPPFERLLKRDIPFETDEILAAQSVAASGRVIPARRETVIDLARLAQSRPFAEPAQPESGRLVYLFTRLHAPEDGTRTLTLESDRDLDLWVGDAKILRHRPRESGGALASAAASLSAGWNRILVKAAAGSEFSISWQGLDPARYRSGPRGSPRWAFAGPYPLRLKTRILGMFPVWADFDERRAPERDYLAGADPRQWADAGARGRNIESIARAMAASRHEPASAEKIRPENDSGRAWFVQAEADDILYLVFDFGQEVNGYPVLDFDSPGRGVVEVGYSEVLEGTSLNPYRAAAHYADRYLSAPGENRWELFEKRAFRYMQVQLRGFEGILRLRRPSIRMSTYPLGKRGAFASSDPDLNRIWQASRHTLRMSMEDLFIDCPWRERTQWWGDARVQALASYYHSGDARLARKGILDIAYSQTGEGITYAAYPTSFEPAIAPEFMALWVLSLEEYYRYTLDRPLLEEAYPRLLRAMRWFEGRRNQSGLLDDLPHLLWVDWAEVDLRGEVTALNCYYVEALRRAAALAEAMSDVRSAESFRRSAQDVAEAINRRLWDPGLGVYRDARQGGRLSPVVSQQANTLAILFDVAPPDRWGGILDHIHDPAKKVVRSATPFFSFYVVQTLYRAGREEAALRELRRWLKMAETPPGTFWEYWAPHFSRSHGWACAPSILLPRMILGVRMKEPAFAEFEVRPRHADSLEWARGSIPLSGGGEIAVSWERGEGAFRLRVRSPRDKRATVYLPVLYESWRLEAYRDSPDGLEPLDLAGRKSALGISTQLPKGGGYLLRLVREGAP